MFPRAAPAIPAKDPSPLEPHAHLTSRTPLVNGLAAACNRIASHRRFHDAVLALIIGNAVIMGLETSDTVRRQFGAALSSATVLLQVLFVLELAIRMIALWPRPLRFFRDGWNTFDFAVVTISLLPASGPFATVARLARVLRTARIASTMGNLRLIIGTMLHSIPSIGHVVALLGLLLYVYGVLGVHLFGAADPEHWGTLGRAFNSLFVILTLEGWVDIQKASQAAVPSAWIFYWSFIVVAVFVVINLFIAVVINNLEEVHREESRPQREAEAEKLARELREIRGALARIEERLGR